MGKAKASAASSVIQKVGAGDELMKIRELKSWYRAVCPTWKTDKEILELVENLKGDDAAICRTIDDWWSQAPKQEENEGWVKSEKRGKKKVKATETTAGAGRTSGGRGRGGPRGNQDRSGGRGTPDERRSGGRGRDQEGRGAIAQPKPTTTSLRGGRGRGRVNIPVASQQKPTTKAWATPSTEGPSGGWAAAVRDGGRQPAVPAQASEPEASEEVENSSASANGTSLFVSSSSTPATHDGSKGGSGSGAWRPSNELAGRGGGWGEKEVTASTVSQEPGTTTALAGDTDAWRAGGVSLPSTSVWSKGSASIINPKLKEKVIAEAPTPSPTAPPPVQIKPVASNAPLKQNLPPSSPQKAQQQPTPPKPSASQKHPKKPASSPIPVQVPPASDAEEGLKMGKWDQGFDTGADQSLSFSFGSLGLGAGSQVAAQTGWNGEPNANAPGGPGVQGGASTNFGGFSDSKQTGAPASAPPSTAAVSPHIKAQSTPDTSKSVAATVLAATVSASPVTPAAPVSEAGPPPGLPPLAGKVTQVHELEAELDRKKAQHQQAQAAAASLAATAAKSAAPSAVVDSTQPTARSQPSVTTSQPPPISGSVAPSATSSSSGPPRGGRKGVGGNANQYNSGGNFTGGYVGPAATPAGIAIQTQHVAPSGSSHHGMSAGQVPGGYAPPQGMHTQQGYTFPQQYGAQLYGYNPYFYAQGAYHAAYNQQGGDRGFAQAMPRGYPTDYSTQASMMGYGMEYGQAAPAQGQYNEAQGQYNMAQSGQALQQPPGGVGGGRRGVGGSALKGGGGQQQGGGNKGGGASTQQPSPPPPSILQSGGVPREFGAGSNGTAGMPGSGYMYNVPPQGMGMAGADQQHYAGSPQWGGMMQQGHPTSGLTSMNPGATHYQSSMGAHTHVNLGASQGQQYSTSGAPGGAGQQQYGTSGEGHSWSQTS